MVLVSNCNLTVTVSQWVALSVGWNWFSYLVELLRCSPFGIILQLMVVDDGFFRRALQRLVLTVGYVKSRWFVEVYVYICGSIHALVVVSSCPEANLTQSHIFRG